MKITVKLEGWLRAAAWLYELKLHFPIVIEKLRNKGKCKCQWFMFWIVIVTLWIMKTTMWMTWGMNENKSVTKVAWWNCKNIIEWWIGVMEQHLLKKQVNVVIFLLF